MFNAECDRPSQTWQGEAGTSGALTQCEAEFMAMVSLQTETSREQSAAAPTAGKLPEGVMNAIGEVDGSKSIRITEKALKRIRAAMTKENVSPEQGGLRLGITGGGCSGLSYNIRFDTKPRERDRVYGFGDEAAPVRIFVDPKSFIYLHGMVLDFEETLMRQGFNFINPNSTKSCGCGSSFSS